MAGNTTPIYSKVGDIQWTTTAITAANTTTDLTSGTSYLVFTADATNGGFLKKIRFRSLGTNVATVARIWLTNTTGPGVAADAVLLDEVSLAASTVSQTSALAVYEVPVLEAIPPGYKIYITIGTAVAAGYKATAFAGKY
jgi:hypothetical protein